MKILLAGASGLVGSAVADAAARGGHEVIGIVSGFTGLVPGLRETVRLNLADETETQRLLNGVRPQVIVNCAAVASPAACDADPLRSTALNVMLPQWLAEAAASLGSRLIHLSSEQVYDGRRSDAYSADETPAPLNRYGRQKLEGEQRVLAAAGGRSVILRPPLLLGNSLAGTRSTHEMLFATWAAGKTAQLFDDEYRQTCTAGNLAAVILALATRPDIHGVFNWAGADLVSRHDLGCRLRDHFGLTVADAPVAKTRRSDHPAAAEVRPARLALDTLPLATRLQLRPQTLAQQLAELLVPPPFRTWHAERTRRQS